MYTICTNCEQTVNTFIGKVTFYDNSQLTGKVTFSDNSQFPKLFPESPNCTFLAGVEATTG